MTIDEAIRHAEDVADELDLRSDFDTDCERYRMSDDEKKICRKCAEEYRQLAEWLKELKALRAHIDLTIRAETLKHDIPDIHDGDMVSRQAVIDVINILYAEHRYRIPGKGETYSQYNEAWQDALARVEGDVFQLPSAETERRDCGWTGIEDDYPVSIREVLDITAETGALYTQNRVRELKPYRIPERKTGRWIPMEVSSGRDSWKCSVCGRRARGKLENLPYCHCGCKMEVERDK